MMVRQAWDTEIGAAASSVGHAGRSELCSLLETTHLKEQCWAGFMGEQLGSWACWVHGRAAGFMGGSGDMRLPAMAELCPPNA